MITKHAGDFANLITDTRLFESARRAWGHILESSTPNRILLPAYIGFTDREGSGVLDPVIEHDVPFDFYPLDDLLQPDLKDIEERLSSGNYQLLLAIHYFGHVRMDMAALKVICERHGVLLVEDCAHAFQLGLSEQSAGFWGDFSFYSIHKHLPTGKGGLLRCNPGAPSLPKEAGECDSCLRCVADLLIGADLPAIASRRRENSQYLRDCIGPDPAGFRLLYEEIPPVPQTLPIIVEAVERVDLYFRMMEKGAPTTALYYRLHDSIDSDRYPVSYDISRCILNLPIHQDMVKEDIQKLHEVLVVSMQELHR